MTALAPTPRLAQRRPLLVVLLALVGASALVAVLVMSATQAAWTASATSTGNEVTSAVVALSGPGAALFTAANTDLLPNESSTQTVTVTNDGTRPLDVDFALANVTGDPLYLAALTVEVGVGSTALSTGTLGALATRTAFGTGQTTTVLAAGASATYELTVTLAADASSTLQGESSGFDIVWTGEVAETP
jgi:hypothetical protein